MDREGYLDDEFAGLGRLSKDLTEAAKRLTASQARYFVDRYYQIQEDRIRAEHQVRHAEEAKEPNRLLGWVAEKAWKMEQTMKKALDVYADQQTAGGWAKSMRGIGPVLAAGLLAYIDIHQAPTVGHIWRFAGLDPTQTWLGREKAEALVREVVGRKSGELSDDEVAAIAARVNQKPSRLLERLAAKEQAATVSTVAALLANRPWNATLKVICWKIGESFVKQSGHADCYYGRLYVQRKADEAKLNLEGRFADQAAQTLAAKRFDKSTEAYKAYIEGRLPQSRIHERAKRWAVKLFLAHFHHVLYESTFGTPPPKPYVISVLGHAHIIAPPN